MTQEQEERLVFSALTATQVKEGFTVIQVNKPTADDEIGEAEIRLVDIEDTLQLYNSKKLVFVELEILPLSPKEKKDIHPSAAVVRPIFEEV